MILHLGLGGLFFLNIPEFDKNYFLNWNSDVGSQHKMLSMQGKGND